MQLTTDNNKAGLEHVESFSSLCLLDAFSTCFMVKIFFIDVERYEPRSYGLTVVRQGLLRNPLKERERMRKR